MAKVRSYKDLVVWQRAMGLTEACYCLTRAFPSEERFGLQSQIRRSAASVAANIAEGHGRYTKGDFLRGLRIASGSLNELETHCMVAARIRLISSAELGSTLAVADEVGRMLRAIRRTLEQRPRGSSLGPKL